ncbi:GntR family transcriptional regulator [Gulosibacter sp. 10]|uniref:GntR family transcriptional regulator n=1 Tax=Gulosibacter sp. 10 TaxID=1255570 RepID=UPI000B34DB94|nr:GntR family transcriptional regulator [Gulosibacter sp. 10]
MLSVNAASSVPVWEQLVDGVLGAIDRGELRLGDRLPTVRRLASDLGLAPGTVARAYQHLEERGAVHTQGRRGTFVARESDERAAQARAVADRALGELEELGFAPREAARYLTRIAEARASDP